MSKRKTTDLGNSAVVLTDELVDPNIARGTMLMRSLVIHETEKEMHRDDQRDQSPSGVKGIDSSRLSHVTLRGWIGKVSKILLLAD